MVVATAAAAAAASAAATSTVAAAAATAAAAVVFLAVAIDGRRRLILSVRLSEGLGREKYGDGWKDVLRLCFFLA